MAIKDLIRRMAPGREDRCRMQAIWNGAIIADSDQTIVLEGNHYFPPDSLDQRHFSPSEHHTLCPWKGLASYLAIDVDGERDESAAWFYPTPSPAAERIKDHVAFRHGVRVVPAAAEGATR